MIDPSFLWMCRPGGQLPITDQAYEGLPPEAISVAERGALTVPTRISGHESLTWVPTPVRWDTLTSG